MAEGITLLSLDKLKTQDGVSDLNRMLQILFDNIPGDTNTVRVYKGYGSPLNVVSAGIGSLYQRLDGGANTTLYVKESGTAATGWVAK